MNEEMKAGNELDLAMARDVMQWSDRPEPPKNLPKYKVGQYEHRGEVLIITNSGWVRWSPSTSIADAWKIVEALRERGLGKTGPL